MDKIEQAANLVNELDFRVFIDRLRKYQTKESINYFFGDRVERVPDIQRIFAKKDSRLKGLNEFLSVYQQFPDPKLRLTKSLRSIASSILNREDIIEKIRDGETVWLNMELIGDLWADSIALIKYKKILDDWDTLKPVRYIDNGFSCDLTEKQIEKLFNELQNRGFISHDSRSKDLVSILYSKLPEKRVQWILKTKAGHKAVQSLIDLFELLGNRPEYKKHNKIFYDSFSDFSGKPLSLTGSNFSGITPSASYDDLQQIIKEVST